MSTTRSTTVDPPRAERLPQRAARPRPGQRLGASGRPTNGTGNGRAHAKAILLGEHAVVHGGAALAVPLRQLEVRAEVSTAPGRGLRIESELYGGSAENAPEHLRPVITAVREALASIRRGHEIVQVRISSSIPHGRGLGSSAAVATAITRAVARRSAVVLTEEAAHQIVQLAERVAHGNPSGIDARAVAADWPLHFREGQVEPVRVAAGLVLILADSGAPGSTAEAVARVRELRTAEPKRVGRILDELSDGAELGRIALESGDALLLGDRMLAAHERLRELGVSTPRLDGLVEAAAAAGALGAKLTGGGLGGCVIALADDPEQGERIARILRAAGAKRTWTASIAPTPLPTPESL